MRTRIQVGVVVLVILIGVLAFFSAVKSIREAAARSTCQNNLKQIVVSLQNYASLDDGRFPPATIQSDTLPPERRLSWLILVDPYMEARMDPEWKPRKNEPWDSDANLNLARTKRLRAFACPGDRHALEPEGVSLSSYVGVTGVGSDAATLPREDKRAGLFGYDRQTALMEIRDGADTTIAVIETSSDNGPWMAGGRPTSRSFLLEGASAIGPGGQFGGFHRDAVNIGFVDGSVRQIRDSIDGKTLSALFTIAGDDIVGDLGE